MANIRRLPLFNSFLCLHIHRESSGLRVGCLLPVSQEGTCLIEFWGKKPGKEGRWVRKEVRDPVIENKILKGFKQVVR